MGKNDKFRFAIADIVVELLGEDNLTLTPPKAYLGFVSKKSADLVLKLKRYLPFFKNQKKLFSAYRQWDVFYRDKKLIFNFYSLDLKPNLYKMAVIERDFRSGEVYLREDLPEGFMLNFWEYPLDEVLFLGLLTYRRLGVMLHSCGIKKDTEGILFAGSSGMGKSTLASLLKNDLSILSDERVILRKKDTGFQVFGTPWHGDVQVYSSEEANLKGLFLLRHAQRNHIKRMSLSEAISKLLVCSLVPWWDKQAMDFVLDFYRELIWHIPVYELGFYPDRRIVDFIKKIF
ncbi:MAG: hypothetical protein NC912_00185 [Candidatus Omnitrophica bacterium]|nr:hypothetical protein [Candidatus Omnitrophota bacterium]